MAQDAHPSPAAKDAPHAGGHGIGRYIAVWAILLVLTITTVATGRQDLGWVNLPLALSIACIKATLVVLFFMHARSSPRLTWIVIVAGLFWLGILLVLTASDYLTRNWM